MYHSKYIGTHNGTKKGKVFQSPATKRTKAHLRADTNTENHAKVLTVIERQSGKKFGSLSNNAPGCMKWPAGGRRGAPVSAMR